MMAKTLREMTDEVRALNTEKGWRNVVNPWGDYVALLHSEVSKMLEAYRDHRLADATGAPVPTMNVDDQNRWIDETKPAKPEGVGSKAADVLIRLLDMCDVYGVKVFDMDCELADVSPRYPASGGPSSFGGWAAWLHGRVASMYEVTGDRPSGLVVCEAMTVLRSLAGACERYGINLAAEYERKMAYNWTRPYQHGGHTLSDAEASSTGRGE